jgi:hypothetical protein
MRHVATGLLVVMCFVGMATMAQMVQAAERPVDVALFSPIEIFPATDDVKGFRFVFIYGKKQNFTGLDLGLAKFTEGDFVGVGIGGHRVGGNAKGVLYGLFNYVEGDFTGWQNGIANWSFGETKGLQSGFYNRGGNLTGVQIGFVNRVTRLNGLQIGLLNFHDEGDQSLFPKEAAFFPFVNWKF